MAIRASFSQQIDKLVGDLGRDDVAREAAVARLIVLGSRGVERLVALAVSGAPPAARAAAFRALEGIGDPRAVDPAVRSTSDDDATVAVAAITASRPFIRGPMSASIVDGLTAAAVDRRRPEAVRVAALRALKGLERATIAPLLKSLAEDPVDAVRALATDRRRAPRQPIPADPRTQLTTAVERGLPDDPVALHHAVTADAAAAPLPLLLALVERVRDRESAEPQPRRMEWMRVRAAAHVALATRGSRIGLYDLREALEGASAPLPVEFLSALSLAGDASCLEALAAAYVRSAKAGRLQNDWWRQHVRDTFRTIVTREKLTKRSAVLKKIRLKWKAAAEELLAGGAG